MSRTIGNTDTLGASRTTRFHCVSRSGVGDSSAVSNAQELAWKRSDRLSLSRAAVQFGPDPHPVSSANPRQALYASCCWIEVEGYLEGHVVGSDRGAVRVFRLVCFLGPASEPDRHHQRPGGRRFSWWGHQFSVTRHGSTSSAMTRTPSRTVGPRDTGAASGRSIALRMSPACRAADHP